MRRNWLLVSVVGVMLNLGLGMARADGPVLPASNQPSAEQTTGATAAAAPAATPGPMGMAGTLLPFAALFVILYFTSIRPQQKRLKEQKAFLSALKVGDEVITQSGLVGKLTGMNDNFVTLEVDDKVRVKMLRSQVSTRLKDFKTLPIDPKSA